MTPPVQALLLDLDDTLIDTRSAMRQAGRAAAERLWPGLPAELADRFGHRFFDDPGGFYPRYASGRMSFTEMRRRRLAEAVSGLGLDFPAPHDVFEAGYREAFQAAQQLFDDVADLLDGADERGVPMVLLTNSSGSQAELKVNAVGLASRFRSVLHIDTLGFGKPDPAVFAHAVQVAGVPAQAMLSVGDSVPRDILPAIAAGMQAVWLHRPSDTESTAEHDAAARSAGIPVARSLTEVLGLLPTR